MSASTSARLVVGLDVHNAIMACTFDPASREIGKACQFKNTPHPRRRR